MTKSEAKVTGPTTVSEFKVTPGETLNVPPFEVNGPVPSAEGLAKITLAEFKFTPPVKLLSPLKVSVPVPLRTKEPEPVMLLANAKLVLLLKLIAFEQVVLNLSLAT